ncbi:MAG: MBL fold metallo-hydrolase [Actinomycetales bacterium]|nr:MBL fold metallo-hydrolase [Actinomycetales bacterium]
MIHATSPAQRAAWEAGRAAEPEWVADDVVAVAVPMDSPGMPSSFAYLLLDGDAVDVVDPGLPGEAARRALDAALTLAGRAVHDVRSIVATHLHPDHLGGAADLRERSGAPIVLHAADAAAAAAPLDRAPTRELLADWGVPESQRAELLAGPRRPPTVTVADRTLAEGDRVGRWRVLATPGHTAGSICLLDEERGLLLTGDELLPTIVAGLALGGPHAGSPVEEHLASLDRLAGLGDLEVLPGHGFRFRGLAERAAETAAHHQRRSDEVAAVLAGDPEATIWEIASRLTWTQGFAALAGFYLGSALRQTAFHAERVRSEEPGPRR